MNRITKILIFILISGTFSACRTNKELRVYNSLPNINKKALADSVITHESAFETLNAKKLGVSLTVNDKKKSFSASMRIKHGEFTQLSVTAPLGIELMRVLLTPDSVKIVDYYNKRYILSDYNGLEERFGVLLDYHCMERVLSNKFITLEQCGNAEAKLDKFKLNTMPQGYQLVNVEERSINRKIKKLYKKRRKNKDYVLITQELLFDPYSFKPLKMSVMDYEDNNGLMVDYSMFKQIGDILFPSNVKSTLFLEGNKFVLDIDIERVEFNVPVKPSVKIPQKYEQIDIK
ncbi:MAG: DUF4292 domain-containing protein [Marinifilaceae bacterium]